MSTIDHFYRFLPHTNACFRSSLIVTRSECFPHASLASVQVLFQVNTFTQVWAPGTRDQPRGQISGRTRGIHVDTILFMYINVLILELYNLIRHVRIKAMKRTKRESGILPGSTHPSTLMWPQISCCCEELNRQYPITTIAYCNCTEWKNQLKIANYVTVGKKALAHLMASASLNALYIKQQ